MISRPNAAPAIAPARMPPARRTPMAGGCTPRGATATRYPMRNVTALSITWPRVTTLVMTSRSANAPTSPTRDRSITSVAPLGAAEDAVRPEDEDQHQYTEGDHVAQLVWRRYVEAAQQQ